LSLKYLCFLISLDMVSGEQTITSAIAAKLKCFFILIESPVCFPRLSVVLFFFSQAFSLQSQKDTFLLYHCSTNLWVDCKKQNFEIHLRNQFILMLKNLILKKFLILNFIVISTFPKGADSP
ncbi:hypothetical protein DW944_11475, partial [Eubacterium ventriosum]